MPGSSERSGTKYLRVGDVHIAFEARGSGPRDIVFLPGGFFPIEMFDDEPRLAAFVRRLERVGRVILLDRRGIGSADPISPSDPPSIDEWATDAIAVLDEVGATDVCFVAGLVEVKVAVATARRDKRIRQIVSVSGVIGPLWSFSTEVTSAFGLVNEDSFDASIDAAVRPDAGEQAPDMLRVFAPSLAEDRAFQSFWEAAGRRGASPSTAAALLAMQWGADLTEAAEALDIPVLAIHRHSELDLAVSRHLLDHVRTAKEVAVPGEDLLCFVDAEAIVDAIEEFLTGVRPAPTGERAVAAILFTDIVNSTERAARTGDAEWRAVLEGHDAAVRSEIQRFGGTMVKSTGDGALGHFPSPSRAVECAVALVRETAALGVDIRAGLHCSEIELRDGDVSGIGVHLAARVADLARTGQVLVSSTVRDLLLGSSIEFKSIGDHRLRGFPGKWELYSTTTR